MSTTTVRAAPTDARMIRWVAKVTIDEEVMDPKKKPIGEPQPKIIERPFGQLHDYPIEVRWDVNRRHPYYLVFWDDALKHHRNLPYEHPVQAQLRFAATLMLGAIGVYGMPVSPATPFAELMGGKSDPTFLTGSVQPVTYRALVSTLIAGLPPADRVKIGELLVTGGDQGDLMSDADWDGNSRRGFVLASLGQMDSPALDSCPDIPLFYVHFGASQRSIVRDMEDQSRLWKERNGLGSSKIHTAKLGDYLKVWDLREGWTGNAYDRSQERKLAEVAKSLKIRSLSTVANSYRSAFQMITGHAFSPELWWRLFGPLKFSEIFGPPANILSAPIRRRLRSSAPQPVPDSRISPKTDLAHGRGLVEGKSAVSDNVEYLDYLIDLRELIDQGLSDEEVARRLELGDPQLVASFRMRIDDFRST